ncbi:hypothetical protein VP01_3032g2 [Puccinia sorghi]|uniref:Uncharacterized protein n=1 Tax=Puccinia sorghi TaxID=27349 RepID=A0A0L6V0T6_9BASI|nr:hypothetical protein VP01_3032g2 [Puccinia sorghi]
MGEDPRLELRGVEHQLAEQGVAEHINIIDNYNFYSEPFETDLDSWNVTVAPDDLIGNYCVKETMVQLTIHAPSITNLLDFNDWVYFFFEILVTQSNLSLIMADYPRSFIHGSQIIMASLLVEVMKMTGIKKIQLNVFGQNCGLDHIYHNFGHESKDNGIHKCFEDIEQEEIMKIKVYSRLVHALKSTSTKHLELRGGPWAGARVRGNMSQTFHGPFSVTLPAPALSRKAASSEPVVSAYIFSSVLFYFPSKLYLP